LPRDRHSPRRSNRCEPTAGRRRALFVHAPGRGIRIMTTAMFLILIVEDDAGLRSILATLLEAHGYRSAEAPDGERAVIEARTHRPDLIISPAVSARSAVAHPCSTSPAAR